MKKVLSVVLSLVLLVCSFSGTFTVTASASNEDALRTAFEEYVASTVITDSGLSSTYNEAGLISYLEGKGFVGVSIVCAGTTTPESYLQHAVSGFKTGVEGYEDLFAAKDGYVAVILSYNGENVGCVATIPAYVYDHTDIDTVSSDSDFTDTDGDGDMDTYTGSAELVILNKPIASTIDWGTNAANIKAIVSQNGQTYSTSFHGGAAFKTAKLPNLKAIRFENGGFAYNADNGVLQNTQVTHVSVPATQYMIPHHFANGVSTLLVVENLDRMTRIGWAGLNGGLYPTATTGQGHTEWHVRASGLITKAGLTYGVTPVFNFLYTGTAVNGDDKGSRRWYDKLDGTEGPLPIAYFASESALETFKSSALYTHPTSLNADYRVITQNLTRVAASVKATVETADGLIPLANSALDTIRANVTLPSGFSLDWVKDTFMVANGKVTGTLSLSDGTNTVKIAVQADEKEYDDSIQSVFEDYVSSTVFTNNGYSSTYSDAEMVKALAKSGYFVTVKESYICHAKSGFTTSVSGYETLFAPQDGYVSAILEWEGKTYACVATIPAYTYDHTADVTTVSKESEFTVVDGTITAYNGSANLLVIDKPVSASIDWGTNAANIKAIVYNGGQDIDASFNGTAFSSSRLQNLAAIRFESVSFTAGADINLFSGNNNLTHVALPVGGVFMVPNHFLNGRSGVVRVDNTASVERFGWYAFHGTNVATIEGGLGRSELYTDANCFNTAIRDQGVTPVFTFYHKNAALTGGARPSARWAANSNGITPIIYVDQTMYDAIHAADNTVSGLLVNPADWRVSDSKFCQVVKVIRNYMDSLVYVGDRGDDLIDQIKAALLADPEMSSEQLTLSWNGTWTVDGDDLSGDLTVSDTNGTSAILPFSGTYNLAISDRDLQKLLETIVPETNVNTSLDFAAQLAKEIGCDPSGIFVKDFYFLRPEGGVKDADGILIPGRKGYAAAVVSATGSSTAFTKTWIIEPEIEDLGKLTVSSDDDFEFTQLSSGMMSIKAYNGNAQKLVIPAVGGHLSGNWTVANKENVQVIVMNNYSVGFEGGILHDFPNLKVVIFNDEASAWYTTDMADVPYVATFKNLPSLKYVQWGKGGWNEHINQTAAIPSLEALPLPDGYAEQLEGRKFNLTAFASTNLLDVVIPFGFQTSGALASHQKLFRIGDTAKTLCEAWVRAQYAADNYEGSASKEFVAAELKSAYGSTDIVTGDWTEWTETRATANALNGTIDATLTLTNGRDSLDVVFAADDVAIGLGTTVADRLQSVIDNYPYQNDTTEEDLHEALSASLMSENGYRVSVEEFYLRRSINGAKDKDGILVPGTDGVVTAIVTLTTPDGEETLYINEPVKAQYETLTFASVSKDSEFSYLQENGEKVLLGYNGTAEKVVVPEGVTEIDMFWMEANQTALKTIRALVLPSTLKKLPYALCAFMSNLEAVYIHDNTVNDSMNDEYAFDHCYSLKYVHVPEGFTEIPANFFNHAKSLAAVHIPDNVTYIGENAFSSTSVSEMVFGPKLAEVAASAFLGSYAPSCNYGSMDFTASEIDEWRTVSAAVVEEARKLLNERGSYYRIFTILNPQMVLSANSLRGGGLPSNRGSHILADSDGWAYEDLVAYGYLTDKAPGNFEGGTVEDLNMTLTQAVAFTQYQANALVLDNTATANAVLNELSQVAAHAEGVTVEWKEKLSITRATETKKGSAKGVAVLKTTDGASFDIVIDEVVSYAVSDACQSGKHTYSGVCDTDCDICGVIRTAESHTYNNACDADCNVCGTIRTIAGHQYDNACDTDCNVCGEIREEAGHRYGNACDTDCNQCGAVRMVMNHQYDNACDTDCNECGITRKPSDHIYDDILDPDCNECGIVREVATVNLNAPDKRVYSIGTDKIDVTGGWIELTYTNGQTGRANLTTAMIKGFDGSVLGKQTLTVVGGAISDTFDVLVVESNTLPTIQVDDANVRPNQTFTVAVRLQNNPGILSAKLAVNYDTSKLELVSYEQQDFVGVTYELTENGSLIVKWLDVGTSNITTDGVFVWLTFKASGNVSADETLVSVDYLAADVFDSEFENVLFNVENGTVTIVGTVSGDVNGDGTVNNKDVGLLQRYINTWDDVTVNTDTADVNKDGKINNKDLGLLQRYVNGWNVELY